MTHRIFSLLVAGALLPAGLWAQQVDRTKYRDYSDKLKPDAALLAPSAKSAKVASARPDHVNNAETPYFPPVFNQDGGSCGSASRICYMFSHELNAYRGLDGKNPDNYYPSHFVWLLTCGNSGKEDFVMHVGVPSASVYGGQTYSKLFGYQEETYPDFGWMQGYDKWYSGMFNRMISTANFPLSVKTEEGREAVKNWLWNHNGDNSFHAGGLAGIGVASGGDWQPIPKTPANDEAGVTGKYYVNKWGTSVDHALTIVGYDDRIEFDLNGNGVYGEESADERGAWIIVNSWSQWWCNGGFIYCPYAHGGAWFNQNGTMGDSWWYPEVYNVRKDYRPLRTIKIKMDYSRRSELFLSGGVSADLNATEPEASQAFDHFKYAGDGRNGDSIPAPEVPMLGRWADGKLHDEPMEFGYDLTDLSDKFDQNAPLKYFFTIQTKGTAVGSGHIYNVSVIDYFQDEQGIETPFELPLEGVNIENAGNKTVVSFVVQGRGVYGPRNAAIADGVLTWDSPIQSGLTLTGYRVYLGSEMLAELGTAEKSFTLPSDDACTYGVAAVYGQTESSRVQVSVPFTKKNNYYVNIQKSGLSIPDVFGAKYEQATIEYWTNCNSLANWNQSAGPGWGTFMFHANADGTLTAGWDTENRLNASGALSKGTWKHIALVVDGNKMTAYVNGTEKASVTSTKHSGIGGFGNLVFQSSGDYAAWDAKVDELRIWKTARTADEIKNCRNVEIGEAGIPSDLVAYYKGDMIMVDGVKMLRDHSAGAHHATLLGSTHSSSALNSVSLSPAADLAVSINEPAGQVYVGLPVTLSATPSLAAQTLQWTALGAGVENVQVLTPTLVFKETGLQEVSVTATDKNGETATASLQINVADTETPDATFTATSHTVSAGERVSFLAKHPMNGYLYHWQMPGAEVEEAFTANAAATYNKQGTYDITLTISTPDGKSATTTQQVTVAQVAPLAAFDVSPSAVVKGRAVTLKDQSKYAPTAWQWQLTSSQTALVGEGETLCFAPETPGTYAVKLIASNEMGVSEAVQEKALVVCNADSKNGLNFSYDNARLALSKVPFTEGQKTFTIDWWMRPATLAAEGNAMGDKAETLLIKTTSAGEMVVYVNGKVVRSSAGHVIAGEWHHYAVALTSGSVRFFRDGKLLETKSVGSSALTVPAQFVIGSDEAPFKGQIDEFRIWNKSISATKQQGYINQPLEGDALTEAETTNGLQVYYQFNQSGGDVTDLSSAGNTGLRSGFGPDGDAWTLSTGVFSLNFESTSTDVSNRYLTNYKEPFKSTGTLNEWQGSRFKELASWTLENEGLEETMNIRTCAHVDADKNNDLTVTTGWDGFSKELTDHKVFQTVELPAGAYVLTATYGEFEGNGAGSYLAVAAGQTLPNTADLAAQALAYTAMEAKSDQYPSNSLFFVLPEPTEVSLGMVVNMNGQNCATFSAFNLVKYPLEQIEALPEGIEDITLTQEKRDGTIYDLYGRRVIRPERGGVYIIGGQKVMVK